MDNTNKVCPECSRKMKQQFVGLQHCECGVSWKKDIGFFERTADMIFALERQTMNGKMKQFLRFDIKIEIVFGELLICASKL